MKNLILVFALLILSSGLVLQSQDNRPNILWITIEDWSPDLSCYGTKGIHTPHVDKLASEGIRYEQAFTTGPVCSVSRSAMMTGFHQNYIEANQHRTHDKQPLPYGIKPIPKIMEEAGYYTCLMSWKTDCNFTPNTRQELFMDVSDWTKMGEIGWRNRNEGQPFFARVTFGGTHRLWNRDPKRPIDIKDVELPPYYADNDFIRRDWANGLEQMQLVDQQVGELIQILDDEGLADNTIVFFIGDHGRCHIRGKQFLYDGGTHIPMIMRWPGKLEPGQINDDMVMAIDICATILEAAEIEAPVPLHGKDLLGKEVKKRKFVFSARDKMDETHDAMRAIRSKDFKLIKNLMPERPYLQYNQYKEGGYPVLAEMNVLNLKGELTPEQAAFFAPTKPEIELFDLNKDPHEINNLADDPAYAKVKKELLAELEDWRQNVIKDKGVSDEFRAGDVFPASCPTATVDQWVAQNQGNYDFNKSGWPAWYPTRTLEEWEKARAGWIPWVFRAPDSKMTRPNINSSYKNKKKKVAAGPIIADWESIRNSYHVPDWFRDAKFGIFLHWGPYAVPGFSSEKYPKGIYQEGWRKGGEHPYSYHRETYGDPSQFGYKDLIPMFKAENYDAMEWAALFKKAGARYVVPVAEHHDGFAMYASNYTRWNAAEMGPKKDVMRMLKEASEAEGMKFGVSSHFALNRMYYSKKDPNWDTNDPEFADLYWRPIEKDSKPSRDFLELWWNRTTDIIDQYEPDLMWFDFGLDKPGWEVVHKEILAYYYNRGLEWDKGVVFQDKNMKYKAFPEDLIVLDIERGRMDSTYKYPWQTDTSVGEISWGYTKNEKYKSYDYLLDELIDIVSKNGCLLLNIGPKADGTIPEEAEEILLQMGQWLEKNGEAVFETRPWITFGEGPTKVSQGHHSEKNNKDSGPEDIRFTTKGELLYATSLGWPEDGTFTVKSLAKGNPYDSRKIESVEFISGANKMSWKQKADGLKLKVKGEKPCDAAFSFRIHFSDI